MAVTFRSAGALAANATTTTLNVVAPTGLANNDILLVSVLNKDNQVCTFPGAQNGITAWTKFVEVNNGTAQRLTIAWARVTDASLASGSTIAVTKPTDNNILFCGVCSAWIGCITSGDPTTGAGTPTTSANASSDTVTYATFDPTIACHLVAIGVYNNDATTAGSISGTDPTFVNRWDLETPNGSDGSIFGYSDDSTGAATGARSHSTTSTLDDVNIGCLLGLEAATNQTFNQTLTATAVTSTATDTLQANKIVTAAVVVAAATMTRALSFGRTLTATAVSTIATMTRGLTFGRTLDATLVTSTATLIKSVAKDVTATAVTSTATIVKSVSTALTATLVASTATMSRGLTLGRTLTADLVSSIATMTRGLTFGRTLTAVLVTSTATMTRALSFGRTLTATLVTSVATFIRHRSQGLPFLYTAANWGTVSFYLEVWMRAGSGTARARLYNDTDGIAVASSDITTLSAVYVRLRSVALTLSDGKTYSVQFGTEGADSGAFRGAKLVVV